MGAAHRVEVVERIAGKDFEVDFCFAWVVGERPNSGEDGIFFLAGDDGAGSDAGWMFCFVQGGPAVSGFVDLGWVVACDFHNAS